MFLLKIIPISNPLMPGGNKKVTHTGSLFKYVWTATKEVVKLTKTIIDLNTTYKFSWPRSKSWATYCRQIHEIKIK